MEEQINNYLGADCKKHGKAFGVAVMAVLVSVVLFALSSTLLKMKEYKYIGAGIEAMNTISVNGEAQIFAVPDVAVFTIGVNEEADTVQIAQDTATKEINDIISYLDSEGIEEKDIKTTNYNVYQRYEWRENCNAFDVRGACDNNRELVGYEVSQNIRVKIRDTDNAGEILAGVGALGVDNISGLSFEIDDDDALQASARREAIADAQSKAEVLADDLGVSIVRVAGFSEGGNNARPMYPKMEMSMTAGMGGGGAPDMPVGENTITSDVTIIYEIR